MSAVTAASCATAATCFLQKKVISRKASVQGVQGLPSLSVSRVVCTAKPTEKSQVQVAAAVTAAATFVTAHPALALVDERLSGEGTGLSLGLSNPTLGWILFGVASLIWALYFSYSSNLPEGDDDSGLSL